MVAMAIMVHPSFVRRHAVSSKQLANLQLLKRRAIIYIKDQLLNLLTESLVKYIAVILNSI